jgi:phosphoribosyl-ATP pyrophosphohydrolase/phosphoribosyl-AMP cyclohydrolase
MDLGFLEDLTEIIRSRRSLKPEDSYTSKLLSGGTRKIGAKIMEEAAETTVAALVEGKERLIEEAADLIYHLMVLLELNDLSLDEVVAELKKRHR